MPSVPTKSNAGETDRILDETMDYMHEVFRKKRPWKLDEGMAKYLGGFSDTAEYIGKFVKQLKGDEYVPALERCRDRFNEIEIDRLRVKPIVKITGEFWAQTTEGDGNFNMFNFLQKEGAQVLVEPIGTWIMYMIHQVVQKYKDFKGLEEGAVLPPMWKLGTRAKIEFGYRQKVAKLKLAEAIFKGEYHKIVNALGGIAHHLTDQYELQRLGHPFYNSRAGGGEGHLEVAKNIYYSNKDLAHMVLSLKPFGCMPSTQSDGAQSAVVSNLQGHDLPAGRDLRRRRDQRSQPRADGAGRSQEQGQEGIRRRAGTDRPDAGSVPRLGGSASRNQAAAVPGAAHQGRMSGGAANFVMHIADRMKAEGATRAQLGRSHGKTISSSEWTSVRPP